jgi:hypothetical protein
MSIKTVHWDALSVYLETDHIFTLIKEKTGITLLEVNQRLEAVKRIATFQGSKGFILGSKDNVFLVDIDDKLLLVTDSYQKTVLKANCPENFFLHALKVGDLTFVHEYGQAPTSIFVSKDLDCWDRLVTNYQLDVNSEHFHQIAYDPYRNWLIALLGDGCMTRVVYSKDLGLTWASLYKGAWQFACVFSLKDRLVFGLDSGIVRGGIGVYYPESNRWDFSFLKWYKKEIKLAQLCGLTLVDNAFWVASLGTPQVILVSKDLKNWGIVHEGGYDENFNYNVMVAEGVNFLVYSTGNSLGLTQYNELVNGSLLSQNVMLKYNAYSERLKGVGFIVKKKLIH